MNISLNWLRQYIDIDLDAEKIAEALTSIGLETGGIEEVESVRGGLKGIVIGKVLTCVEHPDSDHLHITTVDLGDGQPTQIVCGAPNVAAGQTVVVATVGTTLYDGDQEFKIKKSKIRGVESFGMICAEDEIGIGKSHDGIIVITDDVKPGTPAAEYYQLTSDYVIEVDLTPNRIDAASHFGVARDLAAWDACHREGAALIRPAVDSFKVDNPEGDAIRVKVEDTEACIRYSGLTIRNVTVRESPDWLKQRLTAIGQRPINNIVDVTNYILHGFGQPLHSFDADRIAGGEIIVKTAREGETFVTLDGVERKLDSRDLMICDTERPLCIAGVFGGLDSGVTEASRNVFIESACFHPTSVRKTARRQGLNTDASFRFERGVDPNGTMYNLLLAAILIKEVAGGEITGEPVDIYPREVERAKVTLDYGYLDRLVGTHIDSDKVDSIATSLEMEIVGRTDGAVDLLIPTYRVDVTRPCDVVEDMLRIYGYNNVLPGDEVHSCLQYMTPTDKRAHLTAEVVGMLAARGFNEIMCNSLTSERYYADNEAFPLANCVSLLNPLSTDLSVMRQTLLYGGLEAIARNVNRKEESLMLVESGNVYSLNPEAESTAERPLAPYTQKARLGLWITGHLTPANWVRPAAESTFYDLKAQVEDVMDVLGISMRELRWEVSKHPLMAACMTVSSRNGKHLATLGIVSKSQLHMMDIKQPVCYAELDWEGLTSMALKRNVTASNIAKTHPVKRDLALLVDKGVTMEQIAQVVRDSEKRLLQDVSLFDVYEGKNLPEGKKSYAISLTLQDAENTLQDKQIEAVMTKVTANLGKRLGATLR